MVMNISVPFMLKISIVFYFHSTRL